MGLKKVPISLKINIIMIREAIRNAKVQLFKIHCVSFLIPFAILKSEV